MLADLDEAASHIPDITANRAHPNKAALYSFYAKIYLTMGDYTKALKYANDALALNSALLNLNNYDKAEGTTWGRVYKKGNPSERLPDINHPEANYVKWLSGSLQGSVMLSSEMRDLYKKDLNGATDLRKEYFSPKIRLILVEVLTISRRVRICTLRKLQCRIYFYRKLFHSS
jgi:tetratricopeptide (TPR) repeat protein